MRETKTKTTKKGTKKEEPVKKTRVKKTTKEETVQKEKIIKTTTKKTTKEKKDTSALLDKKEQKSLRVLSKIISIVAKILRICAMIAVPIMLLVVIIIPLVFNKLEVNGNIVKFNDVRFVIKDDYITANIGDKTYLIGDDIKNVNEIVEYLNDSKIEKIVLSIELATFFAAVVLIIDIYLLKCVENLFQSFACDKTPFIKKNCDNIRAIGRIMIISLIVSTLFELILAFVTEDIFAAHFASCSILTILVVYILYFIFIYATRMQDKCDTKVYD